MIDRANVRDFLSALSKERPDIFQTIEVDVFFRMSEDPPYSFTCHYKKRKESILARLCDYYGSDKGECQNIDHPYPWPAHSYTDYYTNIFRHCRESVRRVFECGLGTNDSRFSNSMGPLGKPGASLRVWRDYFPSAFIFGGDIDRQVLFQEERIKTFFLDQLSPEAIDDFWSQVDQSDFDLMIDDGLHTFQAGSTLFLHSINRLAVNGIYIIEDVQQRDVLSYSKFFSQLSFDVDFLYLNRPGLSLGDNILIVIRRPEAGGF
jgi:hypothetical protein